WQARIRRRSNSSTSPTTCRKKPGTGWRSAPFCSLLASSSARKIIGHSSSVSGRRPSSCSRCTIACCGRAAN
ncbi:MAG: hypothetical protein AVDCRST_MAG87-186, partial [uncultured Thermomicrobiales bacterium]